MYPLLKKVCLAGLAALSVTSFSARAGEPSFEELKKEFTSPSAAYRSAPLWVWNTTVTYAEIDRMLTELKESGFGGAFVHPRPGLITEYLSDTWFDLYKYSVEKGKKLGLDIWIYDENSYPSGFAGGHVPAQMPESYNQGQGMVSEKADRLPSDLNQYAFILKKEGDSFRDITDETAKYANIAGEYHLYKKTYYGRSSWHGGFSYVDLLYPGVTEKFIDVTMSGYEKTFGKDLGPVVKGVFTDEPNINTPGGIRWTPDLFEQFQKQWGYDLLTSLPSLFGEVGQWKKVRHNYTETLLQLFIDRWAKPWYQYCEEKGLAWTGHYWEHGWPDMGHGGDNMAMYAWHQMPAIDMLFNQFNEDHPQAQFGNVRAVKELRSVANQMGYERTLSETYGGGGWEVTFEDLKRLGDWEYVLGVNFLNQHLAHMTLEGSRKYDYPPVFTYHSPWWPHYKFLNDYFGRLSYLLSQGEQMNDLLVLEPTSTGWLYYSFAGSSRKLMPMGLDFQRFVTRLERAQVEYDLGSENIIKDQGSVSADGEFVVGKRAYKTVVIPSLTENLNAPTFKLLKDFVAKGGKVITFSIPTMIDGAESRELIDFIRFNQNIQYFPELTDGVAASVFPNSGCTFANIQGDGLYHQRRAYKDGELLFLVNSSLTESISGTTTLKGKTVLELDALSSEIYTYPSTAQGGNVAVNFDLPPAGSLMLFVSSGSTQSYPGRIETAKTKAVQASSAVQVKPVRDNVLFLDFCDLWVNGQEYKGLHFADAATKYFQAAGFPDGDPWTTSIQYKQQIADRDTITTGKATVTYTFTVGNGVDTRAMKLATEKPNLWQVTVNGAKVTANKGEWFLDKHFGVYSIGSALKPGVNTVEMSVAPLSIYAEIEPVYVLGNFSVSATETGWTIEKPALGVTVGSWKEQGMPFYSWEMSYIKHYTITDKSAGYAVKLPEWNGTVAQVKVNGKNAGVIAFQPYELDITKYLKKGDNTIEVIVTGSLKNLLGPHHNNPEKGISGPWHWKNIHGPVAGGKYQLLDYGLMTDFEVVSNK